MPNRLATEPSPYLLQHADNPVDWYPWGEEALEKARREDKPILLSIGYSACHWCHVMAHDCFEDAEVAAVMNRLFVNIKVDREERPDLDQIYQTAHQLLTQRGGGWPLTVFLTPDQTPFFAGTYFPKTPRYQLPGFIDLMQNVARAWHERRGEVLAQNEAVRAALAQQQPAAGMQQALTDAPLAEAVRDLAQAFDPVWGGFSRAPKFPRPGELFFLLRQAQAGNAQAREMALFSLRKMASGGVVDQLGGGFCRYSVDEQWAIPHFEKMLYDNGPLLHLYADAWALTGETLFTDTADGIVDWLLREMRAPDGGFYSALDADSEGHEGKFYVWTPDEVRALLSAEEYAVAAPVYGFDLPPNFENASWNPILARPLGEVAAELGLSDEAASGTAGECARQAVRRARDARSPRARRQAVDQLECADDHRAGARRAGDGAPRLGRRCPGRDRLPAPEPVARRAPARQLQARRSAPQRLSRRLRFPARCAAGNPAGRLSRGGHGVGTRARRRAAGAFRGSRMRAASSSPATTTKRCSPAPSPATTTPRRRAMVSPRLPCSGSGIFWARRATSMPARAACACSMRI